ncbi:hypothetical protein L1987_85740 [Smallanthus sonchifolius]|uniref:Uncharacterized protein n=1 Tax=Smallanthus sonchifolius TaxID=185202 RepID=A0ACB8XXC3_9ASTR|nr:hypothetical protein L1987_85740 [Smallanthus sonchifolius]
MLLISSKTQLSTAADDLPISSNFGLQQIRISAVDLFFSKRTSPQQLYLENFVAISLYIYRVKAFQLVVTSDVMREIERAQDEALKEENIKKERMVGQQVK